MTKDKKAGKASRHNAVQCLVAWDRNRSAVQPHINSIIYKSDLSARDRQLAVMLVQGVLRHMEYLDAVIVRFTSHPLRKMKPLTLMTLRVGVYQLLYLDRIPDSAAVNETVKVLRAERQPRWLVNFANGILRNISRNKKELPGVEKAGKENGPVLNHPAWLIRRWQKKYGIAHTAEICRRNNLEPDLVLRVNTLRTNSQSLARLFADAGVGVREGKYAPDSLVVDASAGSLPSLPGYQEGFFHVQDEAAQLVTSLLGPFQPEANYLDACAGLGGKTALIAQLAGERSKLTAVEPNGYRFRLLTENIERLGVAGKVDLRRGTVADVQVKRKEGFIGILVDAPCSGTGVIRRHPDIKWNRRQRDLPEYQTLQLEILQQAAQLLQPGGVLVYATCSLEPEENEQVVDKFLEENKEFSLSDAQKWLPAEATSLVNHRGFFTPTPADGIDGFFGARLQLGER